MTLATLKSTTLSTATKALVIARVILAGVTDAKAPETLQLPGFADFLKVQGVTDVAFRAALSAARKEVAEAQLKEERSARDGGAITAVKRRRSKHAQVSIDARKPGNAALDNRDVAMASAAPVDRSEAPAAPVTRETTGQLFLSDTPAGEL